MVHTEETALGLEGQGWEHHRLELLDNPIQEASLPQTPQRMDQETEGSEQKAV